MMDLGSRIRQARHEAGYSGPERFCARLKISASTLQRYETGKGAPSIARLVEIAKLTGKPLSFFLNGDAERAA